MTDWSATPSQVAAGVKEHSGSCVFGAPWDKRALDIVGSLVGLILLSPMFAVIALMIVLDSPGGAIYRQRRLGLNGEPFDIFKYRTMRIDNDAEAHREYVAKLILEGSTELQSDAGTYKLEDDPRVTRVGAVLRKLSLDEFPQLLNVLRGEMSLVGPRPPLEYEYELYSPWQRHRLDTVPGMTGLWQVSGRNSTTFEEMVDLDLEYIERRSLMLDLEILVRTVRVVLEARGA